MLSVHPSTGVLWDHASGALPTAPAIVVAAHIELCAGCRATIATFEEVGGALLCDAPVAPMGLAALGRVLKCIEQAAHPEAPIGGRCSRWSARLRASGQRDLWPILLRTPASARRQGQPAEVFICVLAGGFRSGGAVYRAGDFGEFRRGGFLKPTILRRGRLHALVAMRRPREGGWALGSVGPKHTRIYT